MIKKIASSIFQWLRYPPPNLTNQFSLSIKILKVESLLVLILPIIVKRTLLTQKYGFPPLKLAAINLSLILGDLYRLKKVQFRLLLTTYFNHKEKLKIMLDACQAEDTAQQKQSFRVNMKAKISWNKLLDSSSFGKCLHLYGGNIVNSFIIVAFSKSTKYS